MTPLADLDLSLSYSLDSLWNDRTGARARRVTGDVPNSAAAMNAPDPLSHRGLRIASIVLPLLGHIKLTRPICRIGNFAIPITGLAIGAYNKRQVALEIADRLFGEFGAPIIGHHVCELGIKNFLLARRYKLPVNDKAWRGLAATLVGISLVAPYGCGSIFSIEGPAIVAVLGLRNCLRSYQHYQQGERLEAMAHLTVAAGRVGLGANALRWNALFEPPGVPYASIPFAS